MAKSHLSESELREYEDYEARLARPILAEGDITDDLLHVLAETALANRALNRLTVALRPGDVELEKHRPHLVMEHGYGIGNGLDDFEDRQAQLRRTLIALLGRRRVSVTSVVRILRAAKDGAMTLAVSRLIEKPSSIRWRNTARRNLEKYATGARAARKLDQSAARKVDHLEGGSFYALLI